MSRLSLLLVAAAALLGAASAAIVETDVLVNSVVVGKFVHEDTVEGARPGIVVVSYDGMVGPWALEAVSGMLEIAGGSRVMVVDVLKAIGSSKDSAAELTNGEMGLAVKTAYEVIKSCVLCVDAVDPTKIAIVGYGLGGNAVMSALSMQVPFQAGIVYTPVLETLAVLDKNVIYKPKMLIMPGYDSINMLDDLEKNNLEATVGMLTFEIMVLSHTRIHFNVQENSNYRAIQALRATEQTRSFIETTFNDAFMETGSLRPESSYDEDKFQYQAGVDGADQMIEGMIVRDKTGEGARPAILVVPPWGGFGKYPIERLHYFAKMGYVAMSANIYGLKIEKEIANATERSAAVYQWREEGSDAKGLAFADRIMAANTYLQTQDYVEPGKTSALGFCFGGTGVYNTYRYGKDLKVHASFHGSMIPTRDFSDVVDPMFKGYLAIYTGTQDPGESGEAMVNFLAELSKYKGAWEMTRYSNTFHGFTEWDSARYSARADGRSFQSFQAVLDIEMPLPGSAHTISASLLLSTLAAAAALFFAL
eukprot:CAMPEP_0206261100 /NCGR_PEP_ID=MMETSP0047_2-20121206/27462_1 /ASSEMBLY_ACC=CAM_ASM_000192 /TAXON_ID=195065 /ORGANISM="Chroomonas mesostigmatica_cf, Strain CCMP1168" /LENGTH=533 /DNA_ID=CAMNT_0053688267 /DNA_START=13 /DNA_END=1614 /DNA_ORIENTATION=+